LPKIKQSNIHIREKTYTEFDISKEEVMKNLYKDKNDHILINKIYAKEINKLNDQKHEFRVSTKNKLHRLNL
jgi:hypothetical protein